MADLDVVLKLCPGTKKLNLHASYAIFESGEWADRDKLEPKHFQKWVDFCKKRGLGCDFNPTFFSYPKCDLLTLSSPNEETRRFWIEHGKACIRISSYLAELERRTGKRRAKRTKQIKRDKRRTHKRVSRTDPEDGHMKRPGKPRGGSIISPIDAHLIAGLRGSGGPLPPFRRGLEP